MNAGPVEIVPGCRVTLHLRLSLHDGTEALSTFDDQPLTVEIGSGQLQPGLEMALYGLRAGATERLTLEPEQAYGEHDPQLVHRLPRSEFPTELQPEPQQVISFSLPNGEETPGTVLTVDEETVTVDFNHPLAGHEVLFEAEIIDIGLPESGPDDAGAAGDRQ